MNISGIRPADGFYDNSIPRIRRELEKAPVEEQVAEFGKGPAASLEISDEGMVASKKEVIKAVKDMEQDTQIHRYQYFGQNKPAEAPVIRGTENFTL